RVDPMRERPVDLLVRGRIDVLLDHGDVLVSVLRRAGAPERGRDLLGLALVGLLDRMTMFTPLVIGGTKTSRTPGMPAAVRMFHAIAARCTDDITLFSLYEPGRVPSRQPRKIGSR